MKAPKRLTPFEFINAQLEGTKEALRVARKALNEIAKERCSTLDGCVDDDAPWVRNERDKQKMRCMGCTAQLALNGSKKRN